MTKQTTQRLRRVLAVTLVLTLLPFMPLTARAEEAQQESYLDGTALVLKGSLTKGSGSSNITLPEGANLYSVTSIRVDEAGAVFPENSSGIFKGFPHLRSADLRGADMTMVTDTSLMFANCSDLASADLSGVDTGQVTDMRGMFAECEALTSVDLSGVDTRQVTNMNGMFLRCPLLETIYAGSLWSADGAYCEEMFAGCSSLVGGANTVFDSEHTGQDYARIDGGADAPGYLTGKYAISIDESVTNGTVKANYRFAQPGTTVTLTIQPNEDYALRSVLLNGAEMTASYGVYAFDMPVHDVMVTASFGFADGVGARLAGHTLSLEGDIGVNFYMELDETIAADPGAYMHFSIPSGSQMLDRNVMVQDAKRDGKYYIFKCNVAAKEMQSVIGAQIVSGGPVGKRYEYSVQQYADYLLGHVDENEIYAEAAPLVRAMLTYGEHARTYFDESVTAVDAAVFDNEIPESGCTVTGIGDSLFDGATLSLKSTTTLSLYFKSSQPLTFSCAGCTPEIVRSGSEYAVRIRNIASDKLDQPFTVTVSDGVGTGSVRYSPLTYCYRAASSDNQKLVNTVKALYQFFLAAKDYFTEEA